MCHFSVPVICARPLCARILCLTPDHRLARPFFPAQAIYPLKQVSIRKVKILRKPRFDSKC